MDRVRDKEEYGMTDKLLIGFGDSIMAGAFVQPEDTYLVKLGEMFGFKTKNAGVPGNTSTQGLARMEEDVLRFRPDICIVAFGMNDHYAVASDVRNVEKPVYRKNLRIMITKLQEIGCKPVLCTINPVIAGDKHAYYYRRHPEEWYLHPKGVMAWIEEYNEIIRQIAKSMKISLADIAMYWKKYVHNGGSLAEVLRTIENSGDDDGVHPTPAGHALYAECIAEEISQWL